ncbi:hypothetical protein EQG63_02935 [Flavobacterium amnicola]|uniref:Lipoprotein n=1 Tax=Flavobacterium amnicola TaxID=2506422 RepID=A0A4Q1K556_9FLAO|nr:hypothetical protein [Flavobacterium amnicola]RXR20908.1 hypothetical protein EQG63_02935 [Flavobacterium amnicola]
MKTLFLFFLTFLSLQNCANKMQEKFPVAIVEAYHQRWVAGVRGGGSGTSVYIGFEKALPQEIELKQLYFRNQLAKANKISESEYNFSFVGTANFDKGDELQSDVPSKAKANQPPFAIKEDEAILEYTQKGEKKYFKITNLKEKEMLAYPSARPQN